ncbi:LysR family transcriptional regulator [Rhizobium phaseoli]|uniref:LysR family transcriptional regulator n=1 Tax=Rhizobium phaseoli TaxID=396 RepID=UPI003D6E3A1E
MAQLEQDLNVRLFDRNKHGSHLTAKGRDLLRYVEQMDCTTRGACLGDRWR